MRHPEEREQAERETRERASRRLAHFILGETGASGSEDVDGPADGEAAGPAETPPVGSADAGARGLEPKIRQSPAEQLADILLYNQGVPTEPRR